MVSIGLLDWRERSNNKDELPVVNHSCVVTYVLRKNGVLYKLEGLKEIGDNA